MNVFVISDLHLDIWDDRNRNLIIQTEEFSKTEKNVFIILGDCVNGPTPRCDAHKVLYSLVYCLSTYGKVIFVLGNHEFYNTTLAEARADWISFFEGIDVDVVENMTVFDFDTVAIIAGTNWPMMSQDMYLFSSPDIGSFKILHGDGVKPATAFDMEQLGQRTKKEWLQLTRVDFSKFERIVIATHFPTMNTREANVKFSMPSPYFSASCPSGFLSYIFSYTEKVSGTDSVPHPTIDFVFGHTHVNENYYVCDGIRVVTNQIGYPTESSQYVFNFLKL